MYSKEEIFQEKPDPRIASVRLAAMVANWPSDVANSRMLSAQTRCVSTVDSSPRSEKSNPKPRCAQLATTGAIND